MTDSRSPNELLGVVPGRFPKARFGGIRGHCSSSCNQKTGEPQEEDINDPTSSTIENIVETVISEEERQSRFEDG